MEAQYPACEASSENGYMVEVIGADGIAHHLGPFKQRAQARRWIAQNARATEPANQDDRAAPGPRLTVV